jgi:hypothetical protein
MNGKQTDGNLKRLRQYIASEAKRLGSCGGRVHRIDLNDVDEEKVCAISFKPKDPLEKDLDELFGSLDDEKKPA